MKKKYEFTGEVSEIGCTEIYRIKALKDFGNVKKGDLGGWIEKEENLSQRGSSWVYPNSIVIGHAEILGNAKVKGYSIIEGHTTIYGNAYIKDTKINSNSAYIYNNAKVINSKIYGEVQIYNNAKIEKALIYNAEIYNNAILQNGVVVDGNPRIAGNSRIIGNVKIEGYCLIADSALIENAKKDETINIIVDNFMSIHGNAIIRDKNDILYYIPYQENNDYIKKIIVYKTITGIEICYDGISWDSLEKFKEYINFLEESPLKTELKEILVNLIKIRFQIK